MLRLCQRFAVVRLAVGCGNNRNLRRVGGDFQHALSLGNGVVAGQRIALHRVAEGIRALTCNQLTARETVGRAFVADPAGLHRQAVGVRVLNLSVRKRRAVILASLATAGQGHRLRRDRQRAGRTLVNTGELVRHICRTLEYSELRHRVHSLLSVARHDVRHGAVRRGCPSEAIRHTRHRKVTVLRLGQRFAVVRLAVGCGKYRDLSRIGCDCQRAVRSRNIVGRILVLMLNGEYEDIVVGNIIAEGRNATEGRGDRQGIARGQLKLQAVATGHRVDARAVVGHRVFGLRVCAAVVHPAAVGGGDHNRGGTDRNLQRVFRLDDVVVGG